MIVAAGIHLMPVLDAIPTPRPSCVAGIDASGGLCQLDCAATDDEILAAIPDGVRVLAIDAPLVVPNATGQRPVEHLLAWLDTPAFPNSTERLTRLNGGIRGAALRDALIARAARVVETLPDLVLRELLWEQTHPAAAVQMDLRDYRAAWLGVRAPRYRPKGLGRATPAGRGAAASILARVVDLGDWLPTPDPDDWQAIADAARLDAIACAYTAWRLATTPGDTLALGDLRTPLVIPADANLRARATLHLARLGQGGPSPTPT
jgi:predicted nuclease with RNAse H fold